MARWPYPAKSHLQRNSAVEGEGNLFTNHVRRKVSARCLAPRSALASDHCAAKELSSYGAVAARICPSCPAVVRVRLEHLSNVRYVEIVRKRGGWVWMWNLNGGAVSARLAR